jgi:predicted enzyme related to lactoylglutathione lyase
MLSSASDRTSAGRRNTMPHTIVHFEIPADDPDKLAAFYGEMFGWKVEKLPGQAEYWSVETVAVDEHGRPKEPGVNGGLVRRVAPQQMPINYISVDSVDEAVARAQSLGATVVVEKMQIPGVGWFAQLADPQGNPFAVFQMVDS